MTVSVKLEIELEDELYAKATYEEFVNWVYFTTGYSANISTKNPLHEYEHETIECQIIDLSQIKRDKNATH